MKRISDGTGAIRKLYAALLVSAMVLALMPAFGVHAFAADGEDGQDVGQVGGYIPFTDTYTAGNKVLVKDLDASGGSSPKMGIRSTDSDLPQYYRSDKQTWARYVKVKDQASSSLCWAFALTTAAEYSYSKEMYEATNSVTAVEELAPGHLGQFYYNRVNDPLGYTGGDFNSIPTGAPWALYGGNDIFAMQHLASWSGLSLESRYPYGLIDDHIVVEGGEYQWTGPSKVFPDTAAYDDSLLQEESIVIFEPDKKKMKDMILKYGAVTASMEFDYRKYMNLKEIDPDTGKPYLGGRSYYNYTKKPISANHAITIVGWDDNYPAERFAHSIEGMDDEEAFELTTPASDGAWIIQNSWGDFAHDKGFVYVSYETADFDPIIQQVSDIYAFDMMPADTYMYNFQYDGNALSTDSSDVYMDQGIEKHLDYYTVKGSRAANIYTNTTDRYVKIEAAGYTTFSEGDQEYKISVYTDLDDPHDPTSGEYKGTTTVRTTTRGCKTAKLDRAVTVAPGDTYSIVFEFQQDSAFGVETDAESPYFVFRAQIDPGQSFFSKAGSDRWVDMNGYNACFRIKGFANPVDVIPDITPGSGKGKSSYSSAEGKPSNTLPEGDLEKKTEKKPEAAPDTAADTDAAEDKGVNKGLAAAVAIVAAAGAVAAGIALSGGSAAVIGPRRPGRIRRHKK